MSVFYSSDAWEDEMAHAAAWLAYAVGKSDPAYNGYLGDAKNYFKAGVPWSMSWSEKRPAVGVSLNLFELDKAAESGWPPQDNNVRSVNPRMSWCWLLRYCSRKTEKHNSFT